MCFSKIIGKEVVALPVGLSPSLFLEMESLNLREIFFAVEDKLGGFQVG